MAMTSSRAPKKYLIYNSPMSNPLQVISVILVIRCQGKFLLVQRSENDDIFPGHWQNMGGKVEVGETIEQAISREMGEEVGLKLESVPIFLHSYSWKKDDASPTKLGAIFLIDLKTELSNLMDGLLLFFQYFLIPRNFHMELQYIFLNFCHILQYKFWQQTLLRKNLIL